MKPPKELLRLPELLAIWPQLDPMQQQAYKDYFARLTASWVNYSATMSPEKKQDMLRKAVEELNYRIAASKRSVALLDELSPSPRPATNTAPH